MLANRNETTTAAERCFIPPTITTKPWKYASNFRLTAEETRSNFPILSTFHRLLLYKNIKDSTTFNELVNLTKRTPRSAEITRISHDKRRDLLIIQRQIPTLTYRRPGWFVYFGHASTSKFNLARKMILHLHDSINQYLSVALFLKRFLLLSGTLGISR